MLMSLETSVIRGVGNVGYYAPLPFDAHTRGQGHNLDLLLQLSRLTGKCFTVFHSRLKIDSPMAPGFFSVIMTQHVCNCELNYKKGGKNGDDTHVSQMFLPHTFIHP